MAESKKPTKREKGFDFPVDAYAYAPDKSKPSTWKLRLWENPTDKETPKQIGLAVAAIGKGFRGKVVQIPSSDKPKVVKRIRAAWRRVHKRGDTMPDVLQEGRLQQLQEYVQQVNRLEVDADKFIIKGVKVLGLESANSRTYPKETIARSLDLYEGARVNVDHPTNPKSPRSYSDRIGNLRSVRLGSNDSGLFADLHINPRHILAEQLMWDSLNAPHNVGLSHNVIGRTATRSGKCVVEEIRQVLSVDLVGDPATTKGLFEEKESMFEKPESALIDLATLEQDHPEVYSAIVEHLTPVDADKPDPKVDKLIKENALLHSKLAKIEEDQKKLEVEKSVSQLLESLPEACKTDTLKQRLTEITNASGIKSAEGFVKELMEHVQVSEKPKSKSKDGATSVDPKQFLETITK